MKHALHIYFWLLVTIVSLGCQKSVEVDLFPPFQRKLVPSIFIGAGDTSATAYLQYTLPLFGDTGTQERVNVKNAKMVLTTPSGPIVLSYDENNQYYYVGLNAPIEPGQTLRIDVDDSIEQTNGSAVVPQPVDVSVSLTFDSSLFLGELTRYQAKLTYTLNGSQPAYVRIFPQLFMEDGWMENLIDEQFTPIKLLLPGQSVTQQFNLVKPYEEAVPSFMQVVVVSCDVHYARYYNSVASSFLEFFPATEPTMDYSNMSNGIGIIAAYTISETETIFIKP